MGEVFRARDTRLERNVAIKILSESFAADLERRARFDREAKTLATLNHPNIAAIYGVEESAGGPAIVMELVPGPTLAEDPPVDQTDVMAVARQVAEALEAAHDAGIIHRDLKPANVKRRPDGVVKVLDFGLAKAVDQGTRDDSRRLTITSPAITEHGVILGTAAYMSPEQARGRPIDKRTDIWSFGVMLFEWLSRRRAFAGETVSDTIAMVLTRDPDWNALPGDLPDSIKRLLARCLEKDPKRRLRDIGEAHLILSGVDSQPDAGRESMRTAAPAAMLPARASRWQPWVIATLAVVSAGLLWNRLSLRPADRTPLHLDLQTPPGSILPLDEQPAVTISPDGTSVAFVAVESGTRRLYVRRMDQAVAQPVAGTEDAYDPVFSPDNRTIAFTANRELKRVVPGEAPVTLTSSLNSSRGIAWLDERTIVYVPEPRAGLSRIGVDGTGAVVLTKTDAAKGERSHRWPIALRGGQVVLFVVGSLSSPDSYDDARIDALVLGTGERRKVLEGATFVRYVSTGHLVFTRGGLLYAVPFDPEKLEVTGIPAVVVSGVAVDTNTGAAHFDVSADGTLIHVPGSPTSNLRRLVWVERSGKAAAVEAAPAVFNDPRISPDGTRAAYTNGPIGNSDVWIYDFSRSAATRLTNDGKSVTPIWSRDSLRVYYSSIDTSARKSTFFRRVADGSRDAEAVASTDQRAQLGGVGPLEQHLFLSISDWLGFFDVAMIPVGATAGALTRLVASPAGEYGVTLSRNGQWMAYTSDTNGRREVYVRSSGGGPGLAQVSTGGGEEPHWSADGRELYYRSGDRLFAASVETSGALRVGKPVVLFQGVYNLQSESGYSYDVDPKTGRFLMIRLADEHARDPGAGFRVIVNWFSELEK